MHAHSMRFVHMGETLTHVGELLQKVQRESGMQVTKLSEKLGYAVRTIYQHYDKETLDPEIIAKYGRALKHDFSKDIPELSAYINAENINLVREEQTPYGNNALNEALNDRDKWKTIAYKHLEESKSLLEEVSKWKEKYYDLLIRKKEIGKTG